MTLSETKILKMLNIIRDTQLSHKSDEAYPTAMDWMFMSPLNSYTEALILNAIVFRGGL